MMLAFYLAAPEVENDRRALNVFNGMRRAKKEGRYMGVAPIGYANRVSESGKKHIAIMEDEARFLRWAFQEIATGRWTTEQVWKMARQKGLSRCSKNNFWVAIRNTVYCGKIFIPKYKDEESRLVQGQHEPLISEALFYEVQDVLSGRRKVQRTKVSVDSALPLRGFLICPKCGKALTGSASLGSQKKYYHYYHCETTCGVRYNANKVNNGIIEELRKYTWDLPNLQLYKEVIICLFKEKTNLQLTQTRQLSSQIIQLNKRMVIARELLLAGDIQGDDYRTIKQECETNINRLEVQLTNSIALTINIELSWDKACSNLSGLDILYFNGSIIQKRKIISSMFPEKLTFDGFQYRTSRINEALSLISLISNKIQGKKNGTNRKISDLSQEVNWLGLERINTGKGFRPCLKPV